MEEGKEGVQEPGDLECCFLNEHDRIHCTHEQLLWLPAQNQAS